MSEVSSRSIAGLLVLALSSQFAASTAPLILPLLACAGLLFIATLPAAPARAWDRLELAVALWLGCWLLSAVAAIRPQHAFALSVPALVFALCFVLLHRDDSQRRLPLSLGLLCLLASAQAAAILGARLAGAPPPDAIAGSGSSWLLVPNDLVWMLCLWPVWWHLARCHGRPMVIASVPLLTVQAAAAIALQSRLAVLVLAGLALCALRPAPSMPPGRRRANFSPRIAVLAGAAVCAAVILLLAFAKGGASLEARWQLWGAAWRMWLAHPWLGVGPHGFGLEYRGFIEGTIVDPRPTAWPHQLALELLANTGLITFAAFLRVMYIAVLGTMGVTRADTPGMRSLRCALLAFAAVSLLEASSLRLWWWLVLAVLLATAYARHDKDSNNK